MKKDYLTSLEIAKKWNLSDRSVRNYCNHGKVLGAILDGKTWLIPKNATKPLRQKRFSSRERKLLEILKDDEVNQIAPIISNEKVIKMIDILLDTIKEFKNVSSLVPIFEITLLKLTSLDGTPSVQNKVEVTPEIKQPEPVKEVVPEPIIAPKIETPKPEISKPGVPEPILDEPILNDAKLDDSVIYLKDAEKEDNFEIDDELMIKVMVSSKKEIKQSLLDGWKNIKKFTTNPLLGKASGLLIDARPLVASQKIVVLEVPVKTTADKINEINNLNYDGVYLVKESKRFYPYEKTLSHVLGYVGIDNQGLSGLELIYDKFLTGA